VGVVAIFVVWVGLVGLWVGLARVIAIIGVVWFQSGLYAGSVP